MTGWLIEPLTHGFVVRAVLELVLVGAVSGAIGCWVVLHRISYSAESLAHGMFPGLVAATLLGVPLLAGGAVGILAAAITIGIVTRFSPGEADTAIAVVVTTLFGLGALLALSPATPPGIRDLLFGDPLGVSYGDLVAAALLGAAVLAVAWRAHDRLLAVGFAGPRTPSGFSPAAVQVLLLVLVAITVLVGVKGLGNLLVAAMLVGPAASARLLTDRIGPMIAVSIAAAIIAGVAGIWLSYHAGIAAGAAVIVCLIAIYGIAAAISWTRSRSRSAAGGSARGEPDGSTPLADTTGPIHSLNPEGGPG